MLNLVKSVKDIDHGFGLSKSLNLEHLTTGAFSNIMGKWLPQFPMQLMPWMSNGMFSQGFPLLSMVQNLQTSAQGVLEPMIGDIGGSLDIRSAVQLPSTTTGIPLSSVNTTSILVKSVDDSTITFRVDLRLFPTSDKSISHMYQQGANTLKVDITRSGNNATLIATKKAGTIILSTKHYTANLSFDPTDLVLLPYEQAGLRAYADQTGHSNGLGVDIGIVGFNHNPFLVSRDIQKLIKNASSINMIFDNTSGWFHVNIDPEKVKGRRNNSEPPKITSVDLAAGEVYDGIAAMRGYV